ncbi:hypothetical protein C8R43DRAFT_1143436 [Mycena crocata]|nr:hypothetical protein C8R43DRAFT_1143436 [Mycena crocata]
MSLYNFMFTESSTLEQPWFIDAERGHIATGCDMKKCTDALAQGLHSLELGSSMSVDTSNNGRHVDHGIRSVIGIVTPNSLDFATVVWASHKLGCTVAPINSASTVDELKHQFALSGARIIFAHDGCLERVLHAAVASQIPTSHIVIISSTEGFVSPSGMLTLEALIKLGENELYFGKQALLEYETSAIAFLSFSSGTTGLPKAVILPHSAIIANIVQLRNASVPTSRISRGDRALGVIPFSHIFGLVTLVHLCPHLGVATVIFNSMPAFSMLLEDIMRFRINHFFLVPSLVSAFVKNPATAHYDLGFFKSAMIAAAPLDGGMESSFQKIGGAEFLVTQVFGMTECGGMITGLPFGMAPRPGCVGTLLSSTEAKILSDDGHVLPPGQPGHLSVRGPQLCCGYLDNEHATQDAFDAEGFLLTGDIADMSTDGYFRIVDRAKRMIKNKGYQVSPAELEAHLLSLELIADAGVIGRPDEWCGEVPVAFVVLSTLGKDQAMRDSDAVKDAIKISVQEAKSPYKWLHAVHFVQTIPRLPSSKIIISRLKQFLDAVEPSEVKNTIPVVNI